MSCLHYRVKLDLRKFYEDVRRFSWTCINGTKMRYIFQLKDHIAKTFNIREPFHLLLNETEYLPPGEDICIVTKNDTIVVYPGLELEGKEKVPDTAVQTNLQNSSEPLDKSLNNSQNDRLGCSTSRKPENKEISVGQCNILNSNLATQHGATENSMPGRKRRRRARKRNRNRQNRQPVGQENIPKKPKIINSYVIPPGKLIHLTIMDVEEDVAKESIHKETISGSCTSQATPSELGNLLSLHQNSFAPSCSHTMVEQKTKTDNMGEDIQMNISLDNTNVRNALSKKFENGKELLAEQLEACPIMIWKPQLKDVIAFKIMKTDENHTTQVSGFVVGEVMSCCENSQVYTFKVLQGASETLELVGKFALGRDKDQIQNDTIALHSSQLIEPRSVYKYDSDRISTPILNG